MTAVDGPTLARSIALTMRGDWGMANLHRICGWLSQEAGDRTGPESRFCILNGHGGFDAARALATGEADLALATPASFARMAVAGQGPFTGAPVTSLRALAVIPQWDRLVLALDPKLGIASFAELRRARPPIRIAVSVDDGDNQIGYASMRLMEAAGISRATLESWGGGFVERQRPDQCIALARDGLVEGVLQEAIMTAYWRDLVTSRGMTLLSIEPDVLALLADRYGWQAAELPAGYFPGLAEPVAALDYSDFLVMVRDDMPAEVAHLLTWCLVETRSGFERQYRHLPPERSPVSYPLEPHRMAAAPIRLHDGAERYYREAGHI